MTVYMSSLEIKELIPTCQKFLNFQLVSGICEGQNTGKKNATTETAISKLNWRKAERL